MADQQTERVYPFFLKRYKLTKMITPKTPCTAVPSQDNPIDASYWIPVGMDEIENVVPSGHFNGGQHPYAH